MEAFPCNGKVSPLHDLRDSTLCVGYDGSGGGFDAILICSPNFQREWAHPALPRPNALRDSGRAFVPAEAWRKYKSQDNCQCQGNEDLAKLKESPDD